MISFAEIEARSKSRLRSRSSSYKIFDLQVDLLRVMVTSLSLLMLSFTASSGEEIRWTISKSGGSTIEVPEFLIDGMTKAIMENGNDYGTIYMSETYSLSLRQYRTTSGGRPYVFLSQIFAGDVGEITYSVDKDHLGVISGYTQGNQRILYGMCRRSKVPLRCIDMEYSTEDRDFLDPIVNRIAKSFKQ